ncbi:MAG: GAF domain-containing protein, partial [Candidatus Omnitrophica bacterium]|nr:GAF domain-containing protein [Candidatus Omnitrophota bacterium]
MNTLKILDDIFGFEGGGLDLILFTYLKRALRATDSQFGIFLVFEKDGNISSMAKVGEFSEKKRIEERAKERAGILPTVLETMKPYIANDLERDPFHISFRDEKVGSEIEYPFYLKDGKKAVLILLSKNKNHFREKHLKEIKRIEIEITSLSEKLENGLTKRGVIFFDCRDFGNLLEESLRSNYAIHRTDSIEEISKILKENQIEFIFQECNFICSNKCKEIFFLSKENFIPVGILRPFSFIKNSLSFSCSIYSSLSLSPIQESIRDLIKESKYHIASEKWQFENFL